MYITHLISLVSTDYADRISSLYSSSSLSLSLSYLQSLVLTSIIRSLHSDITQISLFYKYNIMTREHSIMIIYDSI